MKKHEKAMALLAKEKTSLLKDWQRENGITNKGASVMLGLSERQLLKIKSGEVRQSERLTTTIKLWGRILRQIKKYEQMELKHYRMPGNAPKT